MEAGEYWTHEGLMGTRNRTLAPKQAVRVPRVPDTCALGKPICPIWFRCPKRESSTKTPTLWAQLMSCSHLPEPPQWLVDMNPHLSSVSLDSQASARCATRRCGCASKQSSTPRRLVLRFRIGGMVWWREGGFVASFICFEPWDRGHSELCF